MKRSLPAGGQQGRGPRAPRAGRLAFEPLEGRSLLSTAAAKVAAAAPVNPFPPYSITAEIAPASDPGGTGYVFSNNVLVQGYAVPNSTVWAANQPPSYFTNTARATYTGLYGIIVPVGKGTSTLRVFAESPAQDYSAISSVKVVSTNPIIAWDAIALRGIRNLGLTDAEASRDLALLHLAQYDAVMDIQSPGQAYQVHLTPPKGSAADAAADAAADYVLDALMPSQSSAFDAALAASKLGLAPGHGTADGLAFGDQVAAATLAARAGDGSAVVAYNVPSAAVGLWRPTNPGLLAAADPQWGKVTPFAIASPSAFRPPAPPSVGSVAYDQALAQVASLGQLTSTTRTADQSTAAGFWADGTGTFTGVGHWNEIAEGVAATRNDSLAKDARLFAQLDIAQADAEIATSDAKYTYDTWRPISAIEASNPTWVPLSTTPATPGYVSDHAAAGNAAAAVLSATFGAKTGFSDDIYASVGVTRTYTSFAAAATEQAESGIWGGIQTPFDVSAGTKLGTQVGGYVLGHFPGGK